MKKSFILAAAAAALVLTASCDKDKPASSFSEKNVGLDASSLVFATKLPTKAMAEVTTAKNFTVSAFDAEGACFLANQITETFTEDDVVYEKVVNYYWPDRALSFYGVLPNVSITNTEGVGITVPVGTASAPLTGDEDYVVAKNEGVAAKTTPIPMVFDHILANIDSVKFSGSAERFVTTVTELTFDRPQYGTFCISKGTWSSVSVDKSACSLNVPDAIEGKGVGKAKSNVSFIPGEYTITVKYTVASESDGISKDYEKTATVILPQGQKSTLVATLSNDLEPIVFSVVVNPWTEGEVTVDFK